MATVEQFPLALRIHESDVLTREAVVDFLGTSATGYFVVREVVAARPHFQAIVYTAQTINAVRVRLRRRFPDIVGNRDYSLTLVKKEPNYVRYLCKGSGPSSGEEPDVVACQMLHPPNVMHEWTQYHLGRTEVAGVVTGRRKHIIEECLEYAEEEGIKDATPENQRYICEWMVARLAETNRGIDVFRVRCWLRTVFVKLTGASAYRAKLITEILSQEI